MRLPGSILLSPILPFVFAALCAQLVSPAGPRAQTGAASALPVQWLTDPSTPTFGAADGRINLDVVVTNKAGRVVSGLEDKDFSLLDNDQPAKIVSFSAFDGVQSKPDPAVEIVLVIDTVNHKLRRVPDMQPGLIKFLRQNGGHLAQPVSIYRISDTGLSGTDAPSTDGNALAEESSRKDGLREVSLEKGDLGLQNSSFKNQAALGSIVLVERRKPGRKLLVWVGYGGTFSGSSYQWITEFSSRIREARITLSSVTIWRDSVDNLALEELAAQSGGHVLEVEADQAAEMAGKEAELVALIDNCVEDASVFYTISFDAPRTEKVDEYHALSFEVDRPGLSAHTDTGYYDQPVYYDQPPIPVERVTVDKLETLLKSAHGESDAELAGKLSGMELSERMSSERLLVWKGSVRGLKAWAALVALADASAFLAPPAAEIVADAAPDPAAQQAILAKTGDYVDKTIPKLTDFFATRTTARFEQPPGKEGQSWKTATGEHWLRQVGSWEATVHYRNGFEEVEAEALKGKSVKKEQGRLKTTGTFGPILSVVMADAQRGEMAWSRWERGADGPRAVFRFAVAKADSEYEVSFRGILADGQGTGIFQHATGYHGEITIDPVSGDVLRLTVDADLGPNLPVDRSSILVEYGPVEIGGSTHICLLRSITILRERKIFYLAEWGEDFTVYGPFETILDDVAYEKYHMFRGQARVLSGFEDAPEEKSPDPNPTHAPVAAPPKPQ